MNLLKKTLDYMESAGKISINFQHPILNDNYAYWELYVYDEQTNELLYREIKGTEYNITTAELGLPTGNYYFFVNTYYHSSETYTFKLNYSASTTWETEENDGYGTADIIEVGTNYYGAIQESSDDDYYKFEMNSASNIKINFKHPNLNDNSCYWQIYLYNASTEKLVSMEASGMETSIASDTISLPAGTYYVHVCPYYRNSATYTLSVNYSYATSKPTLKVASQAYNKIKISWNQYGSGSGYVIYRSTSRGGSYQAIKTITSKTTTSYTDTNVKAGKTYYYRVRPYKNMGGQQYYGTFSSIVKVKAAPGKVKISTIKAGSKKATITWKKQSDISGYEIYMSSQKNGKYKKVKTVTKSNTTKYSKTKLAKGKRYYFKVRAYKSVNGKKVYGDFSSVKSVKITR